MTDICSANNSIDNMRNAAYYQQSLVLIDSSAFLGFPEHSEINIKKIWFKSQRKFQQFWQA